MVELSFNADSADKLFNSLIVHGKRVFIVFEMSKWHLIIIAVSMTKA